MGAKRRLEVPHGMLRDLQIRQRFEASAARGRPSTMAAVPTVLKEYLARSQRRAGSALTL